MKHCPNGCRWFGRHVFLVSFERVGVQRNGLCPFLSLSKSLHIFFMHPANISRNVSINTQHSCCFPYLLSTIHVIAGISLITDSSHCSHFLMLVRHFFLLKSHLFLLAAAILLHAFERDVSPVSERVPPRPVKVVLSA
jgi:hypothetical protein